MKLTALISLAGALSAGSVAAVVNNQVLTNTTESAAQAVVNADVNVNDTNVADVEAAIRIDSDLLTSTQALFQIRDAGFVTLDTAGNVLTVIDANANVDLGFSLIDLAGTNLDGTADVVLGFQQGDDIVVFTADLLIDGSIATTVDDSDVADANGTADEGNGNGGNGSGNGNGNGGNGSGNGGNGAGDNPSGVEDANGTADDDPADTGTDGNGDNCTGGLITVCVDADADVNLNDD